VGIEHELENSIPAKYAPHAPDFIRQQAMETWHGQRWPERQMDLHNNAEGIRAAIEGRAIDLRKLQTHPANPGREPPPYGE
jgi:hypothetical protein